MRFNTIRKFGSITLVFLLLFISAAAVFAAGNADEIDFTKKGSVSLTVEDKKTGNLAQGVKIALVRVAEAENQSGSLAYIPTEGFENFLFDDLSDAVLPLKLEKIASESDSSSGVESTDSDGVAVFSDLELGLYLAMQTETEGSTVTFSPFLIMVPESGENGWIYNVEGSPKAESVDISPVPSGDPETPDTPKATVVPKTSTDSELPLTGQLNWPIPVLAVSGMLIFAAGFYLIFIKKGSADGEMIS